MVKPRHSQNPYQFPRNLHERYKAQRDGTPLCERCSVGNFRRDGSLGNDLATAEEKTRGANQAGAEKDEAAWLRSSCERQTAVEVDA